MHTLAKRVWHVGGSIPFVASVALFAASAFAEKSSDGIAPTAPVDRFRIYGFDKENGWRDWQIEGARAVFVADGAIDVSGIRLRIYEASDRQNVNMTIESPKAVLSKDRESISGPDTIVMNAKGIFLGGENWTWSPENRKLTIRSRAHTVIEGEIGSVLE
jgi:hypothetical protein